MSSPLIWMLLAGVAVKKIGEHVATHAPASNVPPTGEVIVPPVISDTLHPAPTPTPTPVIGPPVVAPSTVPFWDSQGVRLGNGNLVLPDGRVIDPQGHVVTTLTEPVRMQFYAAVEAQHGGDALAIARFAAKTIISPRTLAFVQKVLGSHNAEAAVGLSQEMLTEPGQLFSIADDIPFDAPVDAVTDVATRWNTADDIILSDIFPPTPDINAWGFFAEDFTGVIDPAFLSDVDFLALPPDFSLLVEATDAIEVSISVGDIAIPGWVDSFDGLGTAISDGLGGLMPGAAGVGSVIGAVISIGFDAASNMPMDQKMVSIALDILNLALAFIPVIGWALALIAGAFKSQIAGLFGGLSHEEREKIETGLILSKVQVMWKYHIRPSVTPTQLYDGIADWASGSDGGHTDVAVIVDYLSLDGTRKGAHRGTRAVSPRGTPQDFIDSVAAIPAGLRVSIQGGVLPSKLAEANRFFTEGIRKRCKLIKDGQLSKPEAIQVLGHVWHYTRDPVVNVRTWLMHDMLSPSYMSGVWKAREATIRSEMPTLCEVLLSLYYNDLALIWGVTRDGGNGTAIGDWRKLVGFVVQPLWTTYRMATVHARQTPTFAGFLSVLRVSDLRELRYKVFNGDYPVDGTKGQAMFEAFGNRLKVLEANTNILASFQGIMDKERDFQGIIPGRKSDTDIAYERQTLSTYGSVQSNLIFVRGTIMGWNTQFGVTGGGDGGAGGTY